MTGGLRWGGKGGVGRWVEMEGRELGREGWGGLSWGGKKGMMGMGGTERGRGVEV